MISVIDFVLITALSFTTVSGPAESQPPIPANLYPEVETSVDQNEILIGDEIVLTITVRHDPSVEITSRGRQFDLGQFEIKDIQPGDTKTLDNGKVERTDKYVISTFFTGEFEIPPLDVQFLTPDGRQGAFKTSPIKILVKNLTPEESENLEIRTNKPPVMLEGESRMKQIIAIAAGVLALIAVCYFLWRYFKKGPVEIVPPPVPAHIQAYRALEALRERKDLIDAKKYKEFSIEVSAIIRLYIKRRWGIDATEETSGETMRDILTLGLGPVTEAAFQAFFDHCDLMKFARHEPGDVIFLDLIDKGVTIVDETKPIAETDAAKPENLKEQQTSA